MNTCHSTRPPSYLSSLRPGPFLPPLIHLYTQRLPNARFIFLIIICSVQRSGPKLIHLIYLLFVLSTSRPSSHPLTESPITGLSVTVHIHFFVLFYAHEAGRACLLFNLVIPSIYHSCVSVLNYPSVLFCLAFVTPQFHDLTLPLPAKNPPSPIMMLLSAKHAQFAHTAVQMEGLKTPPLSGVHLSTPPEYMPLQHPFLH